MSISQNFNPRDIFTKKGFFEGLKATRNWFLPEDLTARPEAFTKTQLKALADKRTVSSLLFYRSYMDDEDSKLGIFKMHDGRAGIAFKVNPPVFLADKTENIIINLLSAIVNDDTIVHISALAGRDIHHAMNSFDEAHKCENVNIRHPERLKELAKGKKESFEKWVEESMMGDDADLRVRNFTHMISVLFPVGLDSNKIRKQCNELFGVLKEGLNASVATDDDLVVFNQEILNPAKKTYPKSPDPITTLNKRMARGVEVRADRDDGTITLKDGWYAKVLTTEKYPKEVDAFSYQSIFFDPLGGDYQIKLPCPFYLSLTVRFSDIETQRKKVLAKAKWNVGQLSGLPLILEKKQPEIKERRKEAENVIQYINYLGEIPLDASWSLTVYENDLNRLEQYVSLIKASFDTYPGRWVIREETFANIAFYTLLMGLPLNYSQALHDVIQKFDKNFKSNNAQIAPLIGDQKGMGDRGVFAFTGPTGQIVLIDLFSSKENYNVIVIGPMGTGKSFFVNNFLMSALMDSWQIRMIDFGRSYIKASEAIGGQFVEFTKEANICLNFFTHLRTIEIIEENEVIEIIEPEEFESIVPIVGLMMGVSLKEIYKSSDSSSSEKLDLTVMSVFVVDAVNEVFKRHGHDGGMREVGQVLNEMRKQKLEENNNIVNGESEMLAKMVTSLRSYSDPRGQFFKYFNGPNNINLNSHHFVLELDDIATSPMMPVVAMSFLQRTAQEAFIEYLKDMNTTRIIGVDEAHKILGNEIFAKFFDDFGRRIRKYRGVPILITQSLQDFDVNDAARAFFELASWKVFLRQNPESITKAVKKGILSLNPFGRQLMGSVSLKAPHYNELLIKHDDLMFKVLLKVNSMEYWTYTTQPMDRAKIANVMKEYELTTQDAIWVLAKTQDGMSMDKALYQLAKKDGASGNKDWDEFFKYILENNTVHISKQNVMIENDNKTDIQLQELYIRVKDKNGVSFNPGVFITAAREKDYYTQLSKKFLDRVYAYINSPLSNNGECSINIDYEDIVDTEYVEYLLEIIQKLGDKKSRLILEIELNYNTKENFTTLLEFASRIKKTGVGIAFDNVVLSQIDFRSFLSITPKYLKIDLKVIEEIEEDEIQMTKNFIVSISKSMGIEVIVSKIEDKTDIEKAKRLGIDRFQGWGVHEAETIEI